jgi:hypothetical protein
MINNNTEDIDLEKVFYKLILTVKKFFPLTFICIIVGALLGFLYSNVSKKIYGSKMLISSYVLTQSYAKELINNVNLFIQEEDIELLQLRLNLTREVAMDMVRINAEGGLDDVNLLEEKDRVFVKITAQMKDPEKFKDLEKGLIYYLENNEYTKRLSEQRKNGYMETIALMDKQISDLEELRKQVLSGELDKKNNKLSIDPGMIGSALIQSIERKSQAQQDLILKQGVQLVDGFATFAEPKWPRTSTSIWLGIAFGIFIAFAIVVTKLIRERMALGIDNL